MKETTSVTIQYNRRQTMKEIMEIYSLTKQHDGSAYFYNKRHVVNGSQLPMLVSFFLTIKKGSEFLIVVEGMNNHSFISQMKYLFQERESTVGRTISLVTPLEF